VCFGCARRPSTGIASSTSYHDFTEQEIVEAIRPLRDRLAQLEAENAELRSRLADTGVPNEHSARPVPPVTPETAIEKVRLTEDGMEQS
jgi:hypothetical protein